MDKNTALKSIKTILEEECGISPDLVTDEKILGECPQDSENTEGYLGVDDIDMVRLMMRLEESFKHELDDKRFVDIGDLPEDELFRNNTVKELVDFCVSECSKTGVE